jgi:hypothetical protein
MKVLLGVARWHWLLALLISTAALGTLRAGAEVASDAPPAAAPHVTEEDEAPIAPEQPPMGLVLRTDREAYAVGDAPTFFARSSEDCYLTLINIDRNGKALVLFPNELAQDNRLKAGHELALPPPDSPYKFRLAEAGRERLVGICTPTSRPVAGIRHDFNRLRFTVLGDWQRFVDGEPATAMARREAAPSGNAGKPPRGKARNKEEPALAAPDREARAEISYEVR